MAEKRDRGPHQAKNKPILDSAIFGGGGVEVANPNVSNADERKTVILDEDLEGLEFEDRVWLYWRRNKNFIVLLITLAFVVVVGSNAWKLYVKNSKNALAESFADAETFEERVDFSKANANTPAAGVALLQNADVLYGQGKYKEAAENYKTAADYIKSGVLFGRACLGNAVSLLKAGEAEAGKAALIALSKDYATGAYSAEAAYHLGVLSLVSGDSAAAEAYFEDVQKNPKAGNWAYLAQNYAQRLK